MNEKKLPILVPEYDHSYRQVTLMETKAVFNTVTHDFTEYHEDYVDEEAGDIVVDVLVAV